MFSHNVLTTALQKLAPGYAETFTSFHPAFEAIIEKGQKETLGQPFVSFGINPSGPGTVTKVRHGAERINGGLRQDAVRASELAGTLLYTWDVTGEDMRNVSSENDILGLIKKYPEAALADFKDRIGRQLVTGTESSVDLFWTMNGDQSYDPKGLGARQGLFEFAAPTAQTGTLHSLARNSVQGWHTQYDHINSFDGEGEEVLLDQFFTCQQLGSSQKGAPTQLYADPATFANWLKKQNDYHWRDVSNATSGTAMNGQMRPGIKFMEGVTMYREHEIVSSAFTTPNAQLGVVYGINPSTLNLFKRGSDSNKETAGDFAFREIGMLPDIEAWRYQYVFSMGVYCNDPRLNFAVTGGAQA